MQTSKFRNAENVVSFFLANIVVFDPLLIDMTSLLGICVLL